MAALGGLVLLALLLVLAATCLPTGPPGVTDGQLRLVTEILNAVHMETAASRVSTLGPLLLFLVAILLPLVLVIWLVALALRSKVGHEEGIRAMLKSGYSREVTQAFLDESSRRPRLANPADDRKRLPQHAQHPHRRTRGRRRRRANRKHTEDEADEGGSISQASVTGSSNPKRPPHRTYSEHSFPVNRHGGRRPSGPGGPVAIRVPKTVCPTSSVDSHPGIPLAIQSDSHHRFLTASVD